MIKLQVTLFCTTGQYRPISTIVDVESVEYYNTHTSEVRKRAITKMCVQRYVDGSWLKKNGYTKIAVRVYDKEKIEAEKKARFEQIKKRKRLGIMTRRERERNRRKRRIKERVSNILGSLLLLFIIFGSWAIASYIEHNYTREATVIGVTDNNTVVIKDTVGHTWSFTANDDELVKGTKVKVKMNDSCTSSIYDDEIWDYKIIK